jgi:polysaccharide export outer membrane protein
MTQTRPSQAAADGQLPGVTHPGRRARAIARLRVLAVLLLATVVAACNQGPKTGSTASCPAGTPAAQALAAATAGTGPSGAPGTSSYVIGAGDQLGISVYRAPELSVPSLPVRPDGRISMPLIPDIVAAGKTPTELGRELEERLKEYVQDPIVTVMVTGFVGPFERQVKVLGEATEPAAIPYRDGMTVLDVMIATRGLTRYAAGNSAVIVRRAGAEQQTIQVKLNDLIKNGDICQNVVMQPGDTLIIPQSWF